MSIRNAQTPDLGPLARLWWQGWRDAHLPLAPKALVARCTLDSFIVRMAVALPHVRTLGPVGTPLGFHLVKDGEVNQFYVDEDYRGTGIAAPLMADAEERLLEAGFTTPWLACAIGNVRAARFCQKAGWTLAGVQTVPTEIPGGWYPLKVWRYEKRLSARPWTWSEIERLEPRLSPGERDGEVEHRRVPTFRAHRTLM